MIRKKDHGKVLGLHEFICFVKFNTFYTRVSRNDFIDNEGSLSTLGRFVPWNVLSPWTFCLWNILSLGRFVLGTICMCTYLRGQRDSTPRRRHWWRPLNYSTLLIPLNIISYKKDSFVTTLTFLLQFTFFRRPRKRQSINIKCLQMRKRVAF